MQDGLRRMIGEQEDVFYYLTVMNENYHHPAMPAGVEEGIIRGLYQLSNGRRQERRAARAADRLRARSCAKSKRLPSCCSRTTASSPTSGARRASTSCAATVSTAERWNLLHPDEKPRARTCRAAARTVRRIRSSASTDYMKTYATRSGRSSTAPFVALGTDGFGRSDTREQLRAFFEVDRRWVALAALKALADDGHDIATTSSEKRSPRSASIPTSPIR